MDNQLPKDAVMLLSVVNTRLRDFYSDLDTFCENHTITKEDLVSQLESIDYHYDPDSNQFI